MIGAMGHATCALSTGGVVRSELTLAAADDIPVYASARRLARLVGEAVVTAPRGACDTLLADLQAAVTATCALVVKALRAARWQDELRWLAGALVALASVRSLAWTGFDAGAMSRAMFDEVMRASAECRRHVLELETLARRRARLHVDSH